MNYWLLLIPLSTAACGWMIIFIIRKTFFKPIVSVNVLGFKMQGVFPKYRQAIIEQIGDLAASSFSLSSGIDEKIKDPKHFATIKPVIETHMDDFLRHRLKDQMPMIGMFIGDKTIETLKLIFIKEIEDLFPRIMQQFSSELRNELDIRKLVVATMTNTGAAHLEAAMSQGLRNSFQKATRMALLIGLLIGIIQLMIVLIVTP
jgi:uncharacterized membrane protein YheB (UPF0754 family)